MIDTSLSIRDNFDSYIQRIVEFTQGFSVGPDDVRVGAVVYNTTGTLLFTLDELMTGAEVSSTISSVPGPNGMTNYAAAFRVTRTQVLVPPGDRPSVPNVCIFFTDGKPSKEQENTTSEAALLRPLCTLIMVSIGNSPNQTQLMELSTDNRVFSTTFDLLDSIRSNLTNSVCEFAPGKNT